jgi:Bacterial protein of unknown function (DUF924)
MERHDALLKFWFGAGTPEYLRPRRLWFTKDAAFDDEIRVRFLGDWERASRGELTEWENARESCLALVILCDQVPRNLFRGEAKAFSTDPLARAAARAGKHDVSFYCDDIPQAEPYPVADRTRGGRHHAKWIATATPTRQPHASVGAGSRTLGSRTAVSPRFTTCSSHPSSTATATP